MIKTYLIPKNASCPLCNGLLIVDERGVRCFDCKSIFKVSEELCKYGGDSDMLVELVKQGFEEQEVNID